MQNYLFEARICFCVMFDFVLCPVSRGVVNNQDLKVVVCLLKDRIQCSFNVPVNIVCRHNNAYKGLFFPRRNMVTPCPALSHFAECRTRITFASTVPLALLALLFILCLTSPREWQLLLRRAHPPCHERFAAHAQPPICPALLSLHVSHAPILLADVGTQGINNWHAHDEEYARYRERLRESLASRSEHRRLDYGRAQPRGRIKACARSRGTEASAQVGGQRQSVCISSFPFFRRGSLPRRFRRA
mmetsp:Transcript_26837/g.79319  ORF Transcript_26837/g.79319 Transcript_26837/m.79319 type:complete len:245 (+) Transcript_26837:2210-2944(+)